MPPKKNRGWKCKTCSKQKSDKDVGIECDLCNEWIGLECTNYKPEHYNYMVEQEIEFNFLCPECKETIPKLRSLLELNDRQQKLQEDLEKHDTRITVCEVKVEEIAEIKQQSFNINTRLADIEAKLVDKEAVETIAEKCFKHTDFPPIREVQRNQENTQKQLEKTIELQKEEKEEAKRREDKNQNLIVYGIPETQEDVGEQMKADFNAIKTIYRNQVELSTADMLKVARIGNKKPNQIRPVKLTFVSQQKRLEILRKNKNLIIEDSSYECRETFCQEEEKDHKHIYVSPDKTRLQRDEDKKLREELKIRRETEPNLIIRSGKIIKKTSNHARWTEVKHDV